jgi:hypothetical protein
MQNIFTESRAATEAAYCQCQEARSSELKFIELWAWQKLALMAGCSFLSARQRPQHNWKPIERHGGAAVLEGAENYMPCA